MLSVSKVLAPLFLKTKEVWDCERGTKDKRKFSRERLILVGVGGWHQEKAGTEFIHRHYWYYIVILVILIFKTWCFCVLRMYLASSCFPMGLLKQICTLLFFFNVLFPTPHCSALMGERERLKSWQELCLGRAVTCLQPQWSN